MKEKIQKTASRQGAVTKDTFIYMIAKGVEAVVGVLTMSVMTYLFATSEMGQYSTINIAITTVGLVSIQWLGQSVLRYVNKYQVLGEQETFFATVFSAWVKTNFIIIVIGGVLLFLLRYILNIMEFERLYWLKDNMQVFVFAILWLLAYNTSQLIISVVAALRESSLNLALSVITVVGKLLFLIVFCALFGSKIEWIFLSYFITDSTVSFIGVYKLKLYRYIKPKKKSKEILLELRKYGTPLMGNMITTSILNKSDIYILTAFLGASASGIYQTNYSLVATAFTMLSAAVMRGHYPTILHLWSEGRKDDANNLISSAVRFYLLLAIPAVAGIGSLSDVIAKALYAPEYFAGHSIMVWVALAMLTLGLTEYNIKPWEMTAKTQSIFLRSLIGGIVNVLLNLMLVPVFGYKTAAVTTFIGFLIYFILARVGTRHYVQWKLPITTYAKIIGSSLVMVIVLHFVKKVVAYNIITLVLMIIIGMVVYFALLIITGEVRNEVGSFINIINRKRKGN